MLDWPNIPKSFWIFSSDHPYVSLASVHLKTLDLWVKKLKIGVQEFMQKKEKKKKNTRDRRNLS